MSDITDEEIKIFALNLTLEHIKPKGNKSRERFLRNISKNKLQEKLFIYWKSKINSDETAYLFAKDLIDKLKQQTIHIDLTKSAKNTSVNLDSNNLPSVAQMGATLSRSMVNWVKQGFKIVPDTVLEQRSAICAGCEFWDPEQFGGRCLKCGCATMAKLRLAHEKCPLDKWGSVTVE